MARGGRRKQFVISHYLDRVAFAFRSASIVRALGVKIDGSMRAIDRPKGRFRASLADIRAQMASHRA